MQITGWWELARRFEAESRPPGPMLKRQVKQVGILRENGVTHMIVSESGLYLWANPLYTFWRVSLLIPWSEIRVFGRRQGLIRDTIELELASITKIRVTEKAFDAMRPYLKVDPI